MMCEEKDTCCQKCGGSVSQTLEEMDFEKGLWYAAQYGDMQRVLKLLEKVHVDIRDSSGYTALHYAARNGHLDICKVLIDHGANINAVTRNGQANALHRAASAGKYEVVKYLLTKNIELSSVDADGKNALHRAYENNHTNICKLLLENHIFLADCIDNKGLKPHDYSQNPT